MRCVALGPSPGGAHGGGLVSQGCSTLPGSAGVTSSQHADAILIYLGSDRNLGGASILVLLA